MNKTRPTKEIMHRLKDHCSKTSTPKVMMVCSTSVYLQCLKVLLLTGACLICSLVFTVGIVLSLICFMLFVVHFFHARLLRECNKV